MGQTLGSVQNAVDGVSNDLSATLTAVANTINALRNDASGTINNVSKECVESLRIITHQAEYTTALLRNGFLAMMAAIALSILLYLTHFSPLLRAIVWTMYASLCLHMIMTYIRHSRMRMSPTLQQGSIEYQNDQLKRSIDQSKSPTEIDLTGSKLNDNDLRIVISQAINDQNCKKLKLIYNEITSTGASILADALLNNQTLEQLSLWKNHLGDNGVQSLSNALSLNRSVMKKLDLSQNDITDEGVGYIAQMLKTNKFLTHLTLSNNKISDHGIQLLVETLNNRNRTLEVLSLTENKLLTDACVDPLVIMFKDNRSLKKLWINDCSLSKKGQDKLRRSIRKDFELHT